MSNTGKRLTVLGATGSVGREIVKQALDAGHSVTVLVRNPAKLGDVSSRVTVVQGDVTDPKAIDRAVAESEAVLNALGHTKNSPSDMFTVAASSIIASMRRHSVKRLVVLANTTVHADGDQPTPGQKIQGAMMGMMMGQITKDHEAQARLIAESGLDWTIVRAATLADGPKSAKYYTGSLDQHAGSRVTRADVADFMIACVTEDKYVQAKPVVSQ